MFKTGNISREILPYGRYYNVSTLLYILRFESCPNFPAGRLGMFE